MSGNNKTVIVIPCYNEAKRLSARSFLDFVLQNDQISFLFVNDGSSDGTGTVLDTLCKVLPGALSVVHLAENVGKAGAVRTGFLKSMETNPKYWGYWDADLSTPLSEINRFTELMELNPCIEAVLGARVQLLGKDIRRRRSRHYIGRFFATLFSTVLGFPVYDTQCGAKLFRCSSTLKRVFTEPFFTRWLFDVEILARLAAFSERTSDPGGFIREEPLLQWHHIEGSKIGAENWFEITNEIFTLWKHYRKIQVETSQEAI